MRQLDEYRKRHAELSELVTMVRTLLAGDQLQVDANRHLAHEVLGKLVEKVGAHLGDEDKTLYPPLLVHPDRSIKAIGWGFIRNESPLRKEFEAYARKWLKRPDFEYGDSFVADTNEILDDLMKRIEKEEQELFSKLESAPAN